MTNPVCSFLIGGPGSGKDYLIKNIFNRFDLHEVQIDQLLNGSANWLVEGQENILVNTNGDLSKIQLAKQILEGYSFNYTLVSVTNRVSRERNQLNNRPLNESVRIRKWLDVENIKTQFNNSFVFDNSINIHEATQPQLVEFTQQIAAYLGFLISNRLVMEEVTPVNLDPKLQNKPPRRRGLKVPPENQSLAGPMSGGYTNYGLSQTGVPQMEEKLKHVSWKGYVGRMVDKERKTKSVNETAAWQRKEGKSESGGLNKKGVESYRRENPGSKLKTAVTTPPSKLKKGSKAAKRRLSFCRRMKGMKSKLTSAKTARDPNSRINKALRKWNC